MTNEITIIRQGLTFFDKSVILSWIRNCKQEQPMSEEITIDVKPPEVSGVEIPINYYKSNFHRVIHADGIYGGATPTPGDIIVHVYSHRLPIPERAMNGQDGNEIIVKRVIRPGIDREVEASFVMNLEMAKSMCKWLEARIKYVEDIQQKSGIK